MMCDRLEAQASTHNDHGVESDPLDRRPASLDGSTVTNVTDECHSTDVSGPWDHSSTPGTRFFTARSDPIHIFLWLNQQVAPQQVVSERGHTVPG